MKWTEFVKDYLVFTRKERVGIIVIITLILIVAFLPNFFHSTKTRLSSADTAWMASMKKLERKEPENNEPRYSTNDDSYAPQFDLTENDNNSQKRQLFIFDPNTLDAIGWKKLGLKERTIQTILNYLHKGGHFAKPEDLQKIYGLKQDEYQILIPYIQIGNITQYQKEKPNIEKDQKENQQLKYPVFNYSDIDINSADTTAFIALPGIGSKLASRIVNFREKLGGFYSVEQVAETFGLPDSTFKKIRQYLKSENISIRKININTATVDELKAHPYIKWSIANPIIAYRNEHGPFEKIEDIKKIMAVTDDLYNKIAPYLTVQ